MGVKATPGRMRAALEAIASGRVHAIGGSNIFDAFPAAIKTARVALGECRHCRGLLIGRCSSCDDLHVSSCCACEACSCACQGEG